MTTTTLQTADIQELNDKQLEQVNGGFFWFFLAPFVAKRATITTGISAQRAAQNGRELMNKTLG